MIVKRRNSMSDRTRAGINGAKKRAIQAGIGLGVMSSATIGDSLRDRLITGLVGTIVGSSLGLYYGYKEGLKEFDDKQKSLENKKQQVKKEKEDKIDQLKKSLIKNFPEIDGLCKIASSKELTQLEPTFGDGDEYPSFYLITQPEKYSYHNNTDNFISVLSIHSQLGHIGINPKKGYWCEEDHPDRKIPNLKQYLLKYYRDQLEDYKEAEKKDSYLWEEEEYGEVIKYINKTIELINKYLK